MQFSDTIASLLQSQGPRQVISIAPEAMVYEALEAMARHNIGAVLVLSEGKLVGILSERDYARKGVLIGHLASETPVHQIMTTPVVYIHPENTIDECLTVMTQHRFRHLPVVQEDEVVGIVSIGDLVKWTIAGQEQTIHELQGYITGVWPG